MSRSKASTVASATGSPSAVRTWARTTRRSGMVKSFPWCSRGEFGQAAVREDAHLLAVEAAGVLIDGVDRADVVQDAVIPLPVGLVGATQVGEVAAGDVVELERLVDHQL